MFVLVLLSEFLVVPDQRPKARRFCHQMLQPLYQLSIHLLSIHLLSIVSIIYSLITATLTPEHSIVENKFLQNFLLDGQMTDINASYNISIYPQLHNTIRSREVGNFLEAFSKNLYMMRIYIERLKITKVKPSSSEYNFNTVEIMNLSNRMLI